MRLNETLKARARAMRSNASPAEQTLWFLLRAHRFDGAKFARQSVIGAYIVDFAARAAKLVIEFDGDTHAHQVEYDAARTRFLEQQGYQVIRFTNAEVMDNIDGVADAIAAALRATTTPSPNPLPRGRGQ